MLTKHAHILFDDQTWLQLTTLATAQNSSVGALVRHAVNQTYQETARRQEIAAAVERIIAIRPHFKKINYKALINYGRKY